MWRKTPQTTLIREQLEIRGHATNQELAKAARKSFPNLTNTTVHRITDRLVKFGLASYAPISDKSKVIDFNTKPHDHFVCRTCGKIVDVELSNKAIEQLQAQLPGKLVRHSIVVSGICTVCIDK